MKPWSGPERINTPERFWALLDRCKHTGCWLWPLYKNRKGYGWWKFDGRQVQVHRLAYQLTFGDIPEGMLVCHRCDVRSCCNPAHLFVGTNEDNMADMVRKGRAARGARHSSRTRPDRVPRGERMGMSKLCEWQIPYLRALVIAGVPHADIAAAYGIGKTQVGAIASGKKWAHVAFPADVVPCVRDTLHPNTGEGNGMHSHPEQRAHGERNGHARLRETDIRRMRRLAAAGVTHRQIAEEYGVSQSHVDKIIVGKKWGHVPPEQGGALPGMVA